ncbi:FadR/GntR family transcriptional regulator [Pedobacter sp. UBA5917]|uniref:FadR/GntR family transcriptional regulator n=1 Tax=Pedobacter sp. UBA5917 TaxID=1947061 RepID=UPI0025D1CC53|nr:FadR/GntR family transcriptional regulator [Pedobacter sp. UBA5917]
MNSDNNTINLILPKTLYVCDMKLYEKVVNEIKKDISAGIYKTGEKIPTESELMKKYSVGRSSIREAIKTLAISGILTVQQGAGTYLNASKPDLPIEEQLQHAHFDDVNAVRRLLEQEIVRLATEKHQPENIAEIEHALAERKKALQEDDKQKCAEADIAFHTSIANASMNPVLTTLYHSFTSIIRNFFKHRDSKGLTYFAMNHHLHEELLTAIKSRNVKRSLKAIENILDNNH